MMANLQLDLLAELPVVDTARVARIRAHAADRRQECSGRSDGGDYFIYECWLAIEKACSELDPAFPMLAVR